MVHLKRLTCKRQRVAAWFVFYWRRITKNDGRKEPTPFAAKVFERAHHHYSINSINIVVVRYYNYHSDKNVQYHLTQDEWGNEIIFGTHMFVLPSIKSREDMDLEKKM
jgi:hypothetical protein